MKASKYQSKVTQKPVYELFRFKVLGVPQVPSRFLPFYLGLKQLRVCTKTC